MEVHFPATIQIFHHADRGGGCSRSQKGTVPPRPPYGPDQHHIQASCRPINAGADAGNRLTEKGGKETANASLQSESTSNLRKEIMEKKTTDFSGKWKMKSSERFEDLLKALGESFLYTHIVSLICLEMPNEVVYLLRQIQLQHYIMSLSTTFIKILYMKKVKL